jgi:hypothetical protein
MLGITSEKYRYAEGNKRRTRIAESTSRHDPLRILEPRPTHPRMRRIEGKQSMSDRLLMPEKFESELEQLIREGTPNSDTEEESSSAEETEEDSAASGSDETDESDETDISEDEDED